MPWTPPPKGPALAADSRLLFEDQFSGPALDATKWSPNLWFGGVINNELQAYRAEALRFPGDRLIIDIEDRPTPTWWDATKIMPYRSGLIHTFKKFSFTHGVAEARVKVPEGTGLWSAFWLLSDAKPANEKGAEIDVFEILRNAAGTVDERTVHMNYHRAGQRAQPTTWRAPGLLSGGYHTYTVEWRPDFIRYWVDGSLRADLSSTILRDPTYAGPMHLILNCAVGGDWPGKPATTVKQEMWVDYVRVWS